MPVDTRTLLSHLSLSDGVCLILRITRGVLLNGKNNLANGHVMACAGHHEGGAPELKPSLRLETALPVY
jgi:hypothetical protein